MFLQVSALERQFEASSFHLVSYISVAKLLVIFQLFQVFFSKSVACFRESFQLIFHRNCVFLRIPENSLKVVVVLDTSPALSLALGIGSWPPY